MFDFPEQADFYLGRGPEARFLGTVPDGDPDRLNAWVEFTPADDSPVPFDEDDFRDVVANLLEAQSVDPANWSHTYPTSADTPWCYSFSTGALYVDRFGYPFAVIYCNRGRLARPTIKNPVPYPPMPAVPR